MTSAFCLVELDSIVYFIINLHVRHHHFVNFWEINKKHRFSSQHDIWSLSSVLEVLQWLHVNVPKWLDIIRKFIHLKVVIADVSEWITRELTLDLQERIVWRHRSGENCKYVSAALKVWCLKQKLFGTISSSLRLTTLQNWVIGGEEPSSDRYPRTSSLVLRAPDRMWRLEILIEGHRQSYGRVPKGARISIKLNKMLLI